MRRNCGERLAATVEEAGRSVSGGRRLIVLGGIVLAVLVALRVAGELTRDDERAQGPAGSSYAYGSYGVIRLRGAAAALGSSRWCGCATARVTSTSTRG